jgi:threonine synthase
MNKENAQIKRKEKTFQFSGFLKHLKCPHCEKTYFPDEVDYVCPAHENNNRLEVVYDYSEIQRVFSKKHLEQNKTYSIKRYSPLLPLSLPNLNEIPYQVGFTPLVRLTKSEKELGLDNLYLKLDSSNPSGSLKDRASFVVAAIAKSQGKNIIAAASSGNAASSLAAVCASTDLKSILFVPESIPETKLIQIAIYGATVFVVKGTYNQAFDLCAQACEEMGWYSRNTGFNPYTREGKKTVALEICEQLNWKVPDWVLVPVGDGCILSGLEKGFFDLFKLGWIEKIPRIVGIQSNKAASIYNAWDKGLSEPEEVEALSIVDSINVGLSQDGSMALRALKRSNGMCISLSDEEMRSSMVELAEKEGVLGCMAGSSPYAALKYLRENNVIKSNESVVLINTGHGLKDVARQSKDSFKNVFSVQPDINYIKQWQNEALRNLEK